MSVIPKKYDMAVAWAKERVGKRVFRTATTCQCNSCARIVREGLVIADDWHARYLADVAGECGVVYADSKEELQ